MKREPPSVPLLTPVIIPLDPPRGGECPRYCDTCDVELRKAEIRHGTCGDCASRAARLLAQLRDEQAAYDAADRRVKEAKEND